MNGNVVVIVWRESIEAMLIIGILYRWLNNQADARAGHRFLLLGVLAGIALAVVLAYAMMAIQSELIIQGLDYFQLAMPFIAAALLTHMVRWMRRHGRTLKQDLESGLPHRHEQANWWGMAALAAIAVGREGAETVIFLYGTALTQVANNLAGLVFSAGAGFILAFLTFWTLSRGMRFFSWQLFFRGSEIILLLLAAALLVDGVDRLISLGWLPALVEPVWDSTTLLDDSSRIGGIVATLTGYRAQPALTLLLCYVAYWLTVSVMLARSKPSGRHEKTVHA